MRFNNGAFTTPPVVKNLIIINALFFLAEVILPNGLGDLLIDNWASIRGKARISGSTSSLRTCSCTAASRTCS